MTKEKILKKAIEYTTVSNGFKPENYLGSIVKGEYINVLLDAELKSLVKDTAYYAIIFSHDFAKALFGKEELCEGKTLEETYNEIYGESEDYYTIEGFEIDWIRDFEVEEAWAWYLKQMVLEKEPLKYIEKYLKEKGVL